MANWTREPVWDYQCKHRTLHPLQDQGYRSIGCRPVHAQEIATARNERAGRLDRFLTKSNAAFTHSFKESGLSNLMVADSDYRTPCAQKHYGGLVACSPLPRVKVLK